MDEVPFVDMNADAVAIDGISINDEFSIREQDDPFGRAVTSLRKSMTDNDRFPFEIAPSNDA